MSTKSTWMILDDEPDIYDVLKAMFELWGIDGVAFTESADAMAWIEDVDSGNYSGPIPELALIDIRLLGQPYQGDEIAERMRKSPILRTCAIVFISAYTLPPHEMREVMERAGADRFVQKPLPRFAEFRRILDSVLEERRQKNAQLAAEKESAEKAAKAQAPAAPAKPSETAKKSPEAAKPAPEEKPTEPAPPAELSSKISAGQNAEEGNKPSSGKPTGSSSSGDVAEQRRVYRRRRRNL